MEILLKLSALHPQTQQYDPNSWYWVAKDIDEMIMNNPQVFGEDTLNYFKSLEKEIIAVQSDSDKHSRNRQH